MRGVNITHCILLDSMVRTWAEGGDDALETVRIDVYKQGAAYA